MIIVVSDVHLGYDACDIGSFNNFIDSELTKLNENDNIVLLGDIWDFWRANCIDVTTDIKAGDKKNNIKSKNDAVAGLITKKLFELKKQTNIYYIVGNHDYSILYFSKKFENFPFPTHKNLHLQLKDGKKKFYFTHGYEFEVLANFPFVTIEEYEIMCQHLCDVKEAVIGKIESTIWSSLHFQLANKKLGEHFNIIGLMTMNPENRMKELHQVKKLDENKTNPLLKPRNKIEELAMSPVARSMFIGGEPSETIIFGHTHSPFITKDKMIVNSGSWVTDNDFHNTYVKIDDIGDVHLMQYNQ